MIKRQNILNHSHVLKNKLKKKKNKPHSTAERSTCSHSMSPTKQVNVYLQYFSRKAVLSYTKKSPMKIGTLKTRLDRPTRIMQVRYKKNSYTSYCVKGKLASPPSKHLQHNNSLFFHFFSI